MRVDAVAHEAGEPRHLLIRMLGGEGEAQPRRAVRDRGRTDGCNQKPVSSSRRAAAIARSTPPRMSGTIGLAAFGQAAARVKACALASGRAQYAGSRAIRLERRDRGGERAGRQARRIMKLRARVRIRSITDGTRKDIRHRRRPPWRACPSAAARRRAVPHMADPRPPPSTPMPCASSDINQASCRRARPASAGKGARSPSIEKTPSVAISAWRCLARSEASSSSACATSL